MTVPPPEKRRTKGTRSWWTRSSSTSLVAFPPMPRTIVGRAMTPAGSPSLSKHQFRVSCRSNASSSRSWSLIPTALLSRSRCTAGRRNIWRALGPAAVVVCVWMVWYLGD